MNKLARLELQAAIELLKQAQKLDEPKELILRAEDSIDRAKKAL
jgi:hypothetical protein